MAAGGKLTYIDDGFTRLVHICYDAVGKNQQNEVVSTWRAST